MTDADPGDLQNPPCRQENSRARQWGKLMAVLFLVWVFGWIVGPYIETHVTTYRQIATVVEEQGIDSAAYMYMDATGSYDGEYYLADSLRHADRDDYGLTPAFFAGILSCLGILWLGWRYIL